MDSMDDMGVIHERWSFFDESEPVRAAQAQHYQHEQTYQ